MKLASLNKGRDGELIVVSKDLTKAVSAGSVAPTLQAAIDNWDAVAPKLDALYQQLNNGEADGAFDFTRLSVGRWQCLRQPR